MGSNVLADMVTLIRDHPYVSCSLLVFLTPPFWPILMYFSPLLISTALFLVALVTMGPQFEDPSERELELESSPEFNSEEEDVDLRAEEKTRDLKRRKPNKDIHSTFSDWVSSCKEFGFMWVERKLRNENWRGALVNDENVSILQEAFSHRAEEEPRLMVKLVTRRIPVEEDNVHEEHSLRWQGVPKLSNSNSWNSFHGPSGRSFESVSSFSGATNSRDTPHDFFSPHPSLSRRLDSNSSMFDDVEPLPIEHDMPPQITGPASVIAPLMRFMEDASDSDDYDQRHSDHDEDMHLQVGERSLDAESISQDELSLANGTYGQPPPFTVQQEDLPSSSGSDEGRRYFRDLHQGSRESESSLPTRHGEAHDRDIDLDYQQVVDDAGTHDHDIDLHGQQQVDASATHDHGIGLHGQQEVDVAATHDHDIDLHGHQASGAAATHGRDFDLHDHQAFVGVATHGHDMDLHGHQALGAIATHNRDIDLHGHQVLDAAATHDHDIDFHGHQASDVAATDVHDIDLHGQQGVDVGAANEDSAAHVRDVSEEHTHPVEIQHEERSIPASVGKDEIHPAPPVPVPPTPEERSWIEDDTELRDIPELEDVAPMQNVTHEASRIVEERSGTVPRDLHRDYILGDIHDSHGPETPEDHLADLDERQKESEVFVAPVDVPVQSHRFVERSKSLQVAGSLATAESIDTATGLHDLAHLDGSIPDVPEIVHQTRTLGNAISLPTGSKHIQPLIIPPKATEQGPRSPDTDLGYATTPDHERQGKAGRVFAADRYNSITSMSGDESEFAVPARILSTKEKLSNLEVLCNQMPSPSNCGETSNRRPADLSILRATTDEQVAHVSDKLRDFKEDSPSKKFQPDAPQLQITPPSAKVTLQQPPSKSAILASALGRPSIRPVATSARTFAAQYSSSEDSSEDEEIELDSDPEDDDASDSDSDSDFETLPAGIKLRPPPKPPANVLSS